MRLMGGRPRRLGSGGRRFGREARPFLPEEGGAVIRSELVQKLCDDHPDLTLKEVERVVSAFFDAIIEQLQNGGRVELRGFGAFSTRARDARNNGGYQSDYLASIAERLAALRSCTSRILGW